MPRFTFTAKTGSNEVISGAVDALNRQAALQSLSDRYALVTRLQEAKSARFVFRKKGLTTEQLLGFFQQLSVACGAGVTLKSTLDMLSQDGTDAAVQELAFSISVALSGGSSFSAAMAQHPDIFQHYQCMLVRAGEASGRVPEVLDGLGEDIESRDQLTQQIRGALTYPAIVMVVALALSGGMLAWGVPQIEGIFKSMGATLPLPTRIMVVIGNSLSRGWWMWIAGIAASIWSVKFLVKKPLIRGRLEKLLLRTWPFGQVYRTSNVAGFARTLGLLYRSGLPLTQALQICSDTLTDLHMKVVMGQIRHEVLNSGRPLSAGMRSTGYFPGMACELVVTGESAGCLDRMLGEIDNFYSRRAKAAIKTMTTLIEPLLTIVVGIMLGGIILGLALPFLTLSSVL